MCGALSVLSVGGRGEDLRSLHMWLMAEDELRGRVTPFEHPPAPDQLGPTLEALEILAGPAAAALAASLVAWLRHRVGSVHLVVKNDAGDEIKLTSNHVKGLDAAAISNLTKELTRLAGSSGAPALPGDTRGPALEEGDSRSIPKADGSPSRKTIDD